MFVVPVGLLAVTALLACAVAIVGADGVATTGISPHRVARPGIATFLVSGIATFFALTRLIRHRGRYLPPAMVVAGTGAPGTPGLGQPGASARPGRVPGHHAGHGSFRGCAPCRLDTVPRNGCCRERQRERLISSARSRRDRL